MLFVTIYAISLPEIATGLGIAVGVIGGLAFMGALLGFDTIFRRFNLRSFNIAIVGLFIGYLMGQALVLVFDAILDFTRITDTFGPQTIEIIKIALFIFGLYLGTLMTLKSSDEIYVSIPFIKFAPTSQQKKELLVDASVLGDERIIDFCATGLLDHHLIIPRFVIKNLYEEAEVGDEIEKIRAKKALEVVKKLEDMENLSIRYNDTDFPESQEPVGKLVRLARLLDANVLTSDISRIQVATVEGIQFINMHALSNALKPLMQAGEHMEIKIQRPGKEPNQGVGYLEDGTMVVVNGGGDFIGEVVEVQVLSVKHTASGRMIFCNSMEELE
ncbi:MAG TPA: TRAM domain-containing protein [Chlamydiales bacterium]|nr:TRAM domain-containing protein [Chlamydiales bacterium]